MVCVVHHASFLYYAATLIVMMAGVALPSAGLASPVCGNGVCETGQTESCGTCPLDCGPCQGGVAIVANMLPPGAGTPA